MSTLRHPILIEPAKRPVTQISRFGLPAAIVAGLALTACGNDERAALKKYCERTLERGGLPSECREGIARDSGIVYVPQHGYYFGGSYYNSAGAAYRAWNSNDRRNPGRAYIIPPVGSTATIAPPSGPGSYDTTVTPRLREFSSSNAYRGSVGGSGARAFSGFHGVGGS